MASPTLRGVPLNWDEHPGDLPRQFSDRSELERRLQQLFPEASGGLSPIQGGRRQAEALLGKVKPERYAKARNFLSGPVTRLSPYIRHGAISLAEVRDAVFARTKQRQASEKLINELGWRDYWQRLWAELGDGIWSDQEPLKTGHHPGAYAESLPADLADGQTGLACMDGFIQELHQTGWLHNHARMWLAAYVVHWRRIRWQAGAQWFLRHLLDGDPASNNLSWQWVASSFSHKPYFFNRSNLERYSDSRYCRDCSLSAKGCPFEASYEQLEQRLFQQQAAIRETGDRHNRRQRPSSSKASAFSRPAKPNR